MSWSNSLTCCSGEIATASFGRILKYYDYKYYNFHNNTNNNHNYNHNDNHYNHNHIQHNNTTTTWTYNYTGTWNDTHSQSISRIVSRHVDDRTQIPHWLQHLRHLHARKGQAKPTFCNQRRNDGFNDGTGAYTSP